VSHDVRRETDPEEYAHAVHPIITTVCGLLALQKELLPREQHNHRALRAF